MSNPGKKPRYVRRSPAQAHSNGSQPSAPKTPSNGHPPQTTVSETSGPAIQTVGHSEIIVATPLPELLPPSVYTPEIASLSVARRQRRIETLAKYCWKPGQSGNPGGIGSHELEVRKLCRESSPDLVARGLEILEATDDERVFFVGLGIVLDRAFGKPKEIAPEDAAANAPKVDALSDKDLATLRKVLSKALESK